MQASAHTDLHFNSTLTAFSPILTMATEPGCREVFKIAIPSSAMAEPCSIPLTL